GFKHHAYLNELEQARRIAGHYKTNHHEVIIGDQEFNDFLPELVFHQDEPIADPVCVPLYYVAKLARDSGTTVVQVGEGADELFCGYQDYTRYLRFYDRAWRHLARLPRAMRQTAAAPGQMFLRAMGSHLPPHWQKMAPDLLRRLAAGEALFWSGAFIFDEVAKHQLLTPAAIERMSAHESFNGGGLSSY